MVISRACPLLAFLLTLAAFCFSACRVEAEPIHAQSAILMDATTGRVLFEQRADMRIPPASLTKVLSMYVALNAVSAKKKSLHKKQSVSRAAADTGGSRLGLRAGDKVTLDQLLYGMAVASGNDASVATAEYIAGSQAAFVQRMNALARKIGMSRSHFVNVHGLPANGQITTARDMMKLARAYESHYPSSRRYHLSPSVTYRGKTEPNHNPLVSWYPGINGLKTGWITAAGYNIIATASRRGHKLIAVVLGAPNTRVRAAEAGRLLNAGFAAIAKRGGSAAAELGISPRQAANLKKSPAHAKPMSPKAAPKKTRGKKALSAAQKHRPRIIDRHAPVKEAPKKATRPNEKTARSQALPHHSGKKNSASAQQPEKNSKNARAKQTPQKAPPSPLNITSSKPIRKILSPESKTHHVRTK